MAAYFIRYNCTECGETHEIHDYLFYEDTDLGGHPITEVMFEDEFARFRESLRYEVTGKVIGLNREHFILVNAP